MAQDLYFVSLFLNVLSAVVIFMRSWRLGLNPANNYMAGYLVLFTLYTFSGYALYFIRDPRIFAIIYGNFAPLYYLLGPFSFFYVRSICLGNSALTKRDAIHFIPALIHAVNLLPYVLTPFSYKVDLMEIILADFNLVNTLDVAWFLPVWINTLIRPLAVTAYALVSLTTALRMPSRKSTGQVYPSLKLWLSTFSGLQVILFGVYSAILTLNVVFGFTLQESPDVMPVLGPLFYGLYFFIVAFSVVPHLFPYILYGYMDPQKRKWTASKPPMHPSGTSSPTVPPVPSASASKPAVQREDSSEPVAPRGVTGFRSEEILELGQRLQEVMVNRKPYTKPDFSIQDLAILLDVPVYKVRFYLRYIEETTWPDFRMRWRMSEMMSLLYQGLHSDYTIEALAEQCGYENRGTFYQHFRDHFGMTPGEYIEQKIS